MDGQVCIAQPVRWWIVYGQVWIAQPDRWGFACGRACIAQPDRWMDRCVLLNQTGDGLHTCAWVYIAQPDRWMDRCVTHQTGGGLRVDRCVLLIYHLCNISVTKVFGQMILFFL